MSIKKLALVAGGIFLIIVALAVCVSAKFNLTSITSDPYAFILSFFSQWSSPLSAFAVVVAAGLAFIAIREGRRSQKLEMLDQQYHKIEEWVSDNAEAFSRAKHMIELSMAENGHKKELENESESLERRRKELEYETSTEKVENEERLKEIIEKIIDVNKRIIAINERSIDYTKKGIEQIVEIDAKVARSNITIKPLISSIGDEELKRFYESYTKLVDENIDALGDVPLEDSSKIFLDTISDLNNCLQNLLRYIYYLRNRMISS